MAKLILKLKKLWAIVKILIPFTKITIANIKSVLREIELLDILKHNG